MTTNVIRWSFYLLLFLTPLLWTPVNSELFEYNKMIFVYLITIVVAAAWLIAIIRAKSLILNRTPLDIPILLFLAANVASTIFSIDPHTSIWGYYSRSNGGLLSTFSYILLYYALVTHFTAADLPKLLRSMLFGGMVVSLWAIPEHFGISPSCIFLTGQATADCWVQDVQARVFATLGQPNWLAAYLSMLFFLAIYCYLTVQSGIKKIFYTFIILSCYLAFTFTYSRGATFGLIIGALVWLGIHVWLVWGRVKKPVHLRTVVVLLVLINLLFGSALTSFKLVNQFAPPPRPSISLPQAAPSGTQLENGGTESGQIRLIVWQGALDIFKNYPIFGSGVETFAYSYYNFRPAKHNLVSEWEFLYNKAHNEYLNYLSTTGAVGFLTYLGLIFSFGWWSLKNLKKSPLLIGAVLAAYVSYLIQNIFGFSVVMIALLFYLLPGLSFLTTEAVKPIKKDLWVPFRPVLIGLVVIAALFGIIKLWNFWNADVVYARGSHNNEIGNPVKAYGYLIDAVNINQIEPLYFSELGYAEAGTAVLEATRNASISAQLRLMAEKDTVKALEISPTNLSLWRTAIRTYYLLATLNPDYSRQTLDALDQAIKLAPTDPKLPYNKALVLQQLKNASGSADVAIQTIANLESSLALKPNYREARLALADFYHDLGQDDKAIAQVEIVLKQIPNDPEAVQRLESWK